MGFARGLLDSLTRRVRGDDIEDGDLSAPEPRRYLIDGHTRTYWASGAEQPATLVEAEVADPRADRVGALVAAHERPPSRIPGRPRGNPAFSEALFVELMRAQQFGRAYKLLAPDCQKRWGNLERFINAHRDDNSLQYLRGVNVVAVRHVDGWLDPELGTQHDHVAELDVEYSFAAGERTANVTRTVHLVGVDGKWRSLSYPG